MTWSPRTALVTGASSGIGRGVALALAKRGVLVIAVARRADKLDELASEAGGNLVPLPLDLTDDAKVDGLANELVERGLTVDLLINNAGYACAGCPWPLPNLIREMLDLWSYRQFYKDCSPSRGIDCGMMFKMDLPPNWILGFEIVDEAELLEFYSPPIRN